MLSFSCCLFSVSASRFPAILPTPCYRFFSLVLAQSVNNQQGLATTLNNIGLLYYNQGQIQKDLDYYQQSLKAEESIGHEEGIATSLHNIGSLFLTWKCRMKPWITHNVP